VKYQAQGFFFNPTLLRAPLAWLWLPTKRSFVTIVATWAFSLVLSCRIGNTFRERTFALHRQQPDKGQ